MTSGAQFPRAEQLRKAKLAKQLRKAKLELLEQELDARLLDLAQQLGELERAGLTGDALWVKAAISLVVLSARLAITAHAALVAARRGK